MDNDISTARNHASTGSYPGNARAMIHRGVRGELPVPARRAIAQSRLEACKSVTQCGGTRSAEERVKYLPRCEKFVAGNLLLERLI